MGWNSKNACSNLWKATSSNDVYFIEVLVILLPELLIHVLISSSTNLISSMVEPRT